MGVFTLMNVWNEYTIAIVFLSRIKIADAVCGIRQFTDAEYDRLGFHERGGNHRGSSGIRHDYICTEVFGRRIDFRFRERMSR